MIKLTNNNITEESINFEIYSLQFSLSIQKKFGEQILTFIKKFTNDITPETDLTKDHTIYNYLYEATKFLGQLEENMNLIKELTDNLEDIKLMLNSLDTNFIIDHVKEYNKQYYYNIKKIYKNNKNIETYFNKLPDKYNTLEKDVSLTEQLQFLKDNHLELKENTLIISEKTQKVILPFTYKDIRNILNQSDQYKTADDVIAKLYTKPLSYYKNVATARFREAYQLVVKKDNGSRKDAIILASELFLNYNLHPAIISACKNLNELDIYLSCLEYNELDDFHFFDIVYEIPPVVSKLSKQPFGI